MVSRMILNSNQIMAIIPHRYPFLLVDRVDEMDETSIKAIKAVSANEMHFMGHFPEHHVMPGVLIVEALAQAGAIVLLSRDEFKGKIAFFAGIEKMKFRRQVIPGDVLVLEVSLTKIKGPVGIAEARCTVNGEVCASGTLKFAVGV